MICVVDDDEDVRGSTVELLNSLGYDAVAFESAEAFLESAHAKTTACLILDQQLPGMQGLQLQEHLRVAGAPVAIIFITAHGNREGRERALSAGAVAYLAKPYDENALIQALDTDLLKR
jgi:FixJ family two-component response regulator